LEVNNSVGVSISFGISVVEGTGIRVEFEERAMVWVRV